MDIYTIKKIKDAERKKCCICGKEFEGWGNNPWPVKEDGECCDECNYMEVIPARINQLSNKEEKEIKDADPKQELAELIKNEEEAIDLYKKAVDNSINDEQKKLYQHILDDEVTHLEMLNNYLKTGEIKLF